ncbi:hypothetical protein BN137_4272 [Cronobacter condimenti 1330]|uniref:Uncharacterized protein n=1 Tax=Cronobacter condimenti 1330 TaxID=1073999 RepID=K8A474_9ENTR|nr:hypothetical protein BN137_4272 [Cronobacter condimenti 1330]
MSESVASGPSDRDFCLNMAVSRYVCALNGEEKTILRR